MKREIKYKIWDKKFNQFLDTDNPKIGLLVYDGRIVISTGWDGENNPIWDWEKVDYERYIPLEFTGLSDSEGKDIYEGDCEKNGYIVCWDEKLCAFTCESIDEDCWYMLSELHEKLGNEFKIIGNRFENPDLLTTK